MSLYGKTKNENENNYLVLSSVFCLLFLWSLLTVWGRYHFFTLYSVVKKSKVEENRQLVHKWKPSKTKKNQTHRKLQSDSLKELSTVNQKHN